MTTRISVTHLGGNKKVAVNVSNGYGGTTSTTLHKQGDSTEVYVHNAQHVSIEELDQDVDVAEAPAEVAAEVAPAEEAGSNEQTGSNAETPAA